MDDEGARAIIHRFGKAFFSRDRALQSDVHCGDTGWRFAFRADVPDGRVRKGVDAFLHGIEENEALFEQLKFADVKYLGLDSDPHAVAAW